MKKTVSFLSILLILTVLISGLTLSAGAVPLPEQIGDVNNDDSVDIDDVTLIRRYLIGLETFDAYALSKADFDNDKDVTVMDVTALQRTLAHMDVPESWGGLFLSSSSIRRIFSNYGSGKATTGVPVTITADGINNRPYYPQPESFFEPIEYSFEIGQGDYIRDESGKIIFNEDGTPQYYYDIYAQQDWSAQNSITYTFEETGNYSVTIKMRNRFGYEDQENSYLTVVEPYSSDLPVITSVITDKGNSIGLLQYDKIQPSRDDESLTVTTLVTGGSGSCEYYFELKNPNGTVVQGYSADNSFTIDKAYLPGWAEYEELKQRENEYVSQKFAEGAYWVEIPHEFEYDADNYDPYDLIVKVRDSEGRETSETVKIAPIYDFEYIG